MKPVNSILFIAIGILLMVNIGCKKEEPAGNSTYINPPQPPPPPVIPNTAPVVNAGNDTTINLSGNIVLSGSAYDAENNIRTILWSKISGPSSFHIVHPDSLTTTVINLQIGVYLFELNVTDSMGLYGKDTIKVTVSQMSVG